MERVLELYREKYFDLNLRHFHEKLRGEHQIALSYSWVKGVLQGAGLVARGRKRGVHRKRRPRRTIAKRRMQALLVVDFLQELPDPSLGFLEVAVLGAVDFLVFESLNETFRLGIVVRRCQAAHADANAVLLE